jgi:flagellar hook-basal body complex protein FliE
MTMSTLTVTPSTAANAYQRASASASGADPSSFGATLDRALDGAVQLGQQADASATDAVVNGGDVTHVVTALSKAQLALQEIVTVRDKVVQAYQDVMRMSI